MAEAADIALIVGLGNPGAEYAKTRHNAGFWFVDELARRHGGSFRSEPRHRAEVTKVRIGVRDVWLVKPSTFMNRSGGAVQSVMGFFKLAPSQMLVAHDEVDLPVGVVRLKHGGGHGGQNGVRDVIANVGAEFVRLRVGVGHPGHKDLVADYVLHAAPAEQQRQLLDAVDAAVEVVPVLVEQGFQKAAHLLHTAEKDRPRKER